MKFLARLKRMYRDMSVDEYVTVCCFVILIITLVIIHNGGN